MRQMREMKSPGESRISKQSRCGSQIVELAIVLPILLLMTFGTLETCEGIFLQQQIEIAAHEGARVAVRKTSLTADVQTAVADYLDARSIDYGGDIATAVSISPTPETAVELTPISVTVTISVDPNLRMPIPIYRYWVGKAISAEVALFKEYSLN